MMSKLTVETSIGIEAPCERVWDALIQPGQMAQWLLAPMMGAELKRTDDNHLIVGLGPMQVPIAEISAQESPKVLTLRGLPDRQLSMTFNLATETNGTHVSVTVQGFESLAPETRAERIAPIRQAWQFALANLKSFVGGLTLPHPDGHIAAMFGYRQETGHALSVERSICIDAPLQRVWQAITDVKQIEAWYSPGTPWRSSDFRVGGTLGTYDPQTNMDKFVQVIEVLDPPRKLSLRSVPALPELPEVTTYTLREEGDGTRLTISNSGYELKASDTRNGQMEQNAFGYGMMLENLRAFLSAESPPYPWGF
jgi:uncharacterized protein YndB with AHSA1/START domain